MNEHNQETYQNLIQALLNCSSKEELELLLNSHKSLITPDFIQVMEQIATQIADAGELEKADFLWILVEDLTQTLAKGMKVVIDRSDRSSAYLHLVNALITCPSGEEVQILNANLDLIDEGLVQTMKEVASQLAAEGEHDNATWLTDTAAQLVTEIEDSSSSTTEEIVDFLWQVLRATYESNRASQVVYPLLQANLEKINDKLIPVFSSLVIATLEGTEPAQKPGVAAVFFDFSYLIQSFTLGNRSLNLDIAITSLEIVSTIFSREQFPEEWATIQNNLGTAYQEITQGDLTQNIETSIRYLEAALQVRTREAFPEQWAETQNNLGVAYYSRIQGDRVENLELAIATYEAALQVYTLEKFPRDWAELQINLGAAYRERIQGNPDENLELAITAYEAALQVCTHEAFPDRWAMIQNNLGLTYRVRSQDDKAKNLEMEIAAYKAALEVYTLENFSEKWALVQNNLGNAYRERKLGNRSENIKNAIAIFQSIFRVYTKDDFPYEWARIQNNLGYAYREQGQISRAIACFRAALDIYKPTTFPTECLNAGNGLSDTASLIWLPDDAIEGFVVSIEAVETSRAWANTDRRRQEVLSDAMEIYVNMVQICINTQQFERALEYVERSKSRNLVDTLANRDIYPKGNISKNVINNLQRLRREIVAEQRRLDIVEQNRSSSPISSISQPMRSSAAWLSEHNRLNELLKQLNDLITNEIDPIDPSFKLIQQVKPISFNEIVGQDNNKPLLDEHTAILEWYITNDRFHTFIIIPQPNRLKVWSSSSEEKAELQELNSWFNQYLQDYQLNREQWIEKLLERLNHISKILHIDDIINGLPSNCDQIILIPHRFLHLIPLHALPLSEWGCLLDRFPRGVRYAPSCQLLQLTQNQERPNFDRLLAIQNPTKDLGYTNVEVGTIQRYFSHTDVFVENAAQKATLVEVKIKDNGTREVIQNSQLSLANCAHFSCHGEFNFESPLDSALLLADGEHLTLGEIFDLDLSQCRLVTLSACETGLTNYKILSDEYVGIPSSFLYAGSPSVVSSLWTVQDVSTAFLMIKFYQNMSLYETVAIALNQAQIWLRNLTKKELQKWISENKISLDATLNMSLRRRLHKMSDNEQPFKSPFHWAAFCAIGQ